MSSHLSQYASAKAGAATFQMKEMPRAAELLGKMSEQEFESLKQSMADYYLHMPSIDHKTWVLEQPRNRFGGPPIVGGADLRKGILQAQLSGVKPEISAGVQKRSASTSQRVVSSSVGGGLGSQGRGGSEPYFSSRVDDGLQQTVEGRETSGELSSVDVLENVVSLAQQDDGNTMAALLDDFDAVKFPPHIIGRARQSLNRAEQPSDSTRQTDRPAGSRLTEIHQSTKLRQSLNLYKDTLLLEQAGDKENIFMEDLESVVALQLQMKLNRARQEFELQKKQHERERALWQQEVLARQKEGMEMSANGKGAAWMNLLRNLQSENERLREKIAKGLVVMQTFQHDYLSYMVAVGPKENGNEDFEKKVHINFP
eukprot:g8739.t1